MTNSGYNFNRRRERRRKVIKDKKRARIKNQHLYWGDQDDHAEKAPTKKEQIRMKRSENILKAAGIKDVSEIYRRRVRRKNKKAKEEKENMEIDED